MVKKIALEEHFLCPGFEEYWKATVGDVDPKILASVVAALSDFGELRLKSMDGAGIERAVLSIAGPGVQAETDARIAIRRARDANDFLAREIQRRPNRYSGFAHLPMQDAKAAADELERCMQRPEVLRRDDQRPHQRAVSRPPVTASVLGARPGAQCRDLHPSDRPGGAVRRAGRPQGLAPRHLGMDVRDRLARAAAGVRRHVRQVPARQAGARPHGRDAAVSCSGGSTAAPSSTASSSPRRRRNTSSRTSW